METPSAFKISPGKSEAFERLLNVGRYFITNLPLREARFVLCVFQIRPPAVFSSVQTFVHNYQALRD